ncbi:hypothetical protein H8E52_13195 [bacterium]|nr:hypothetical protein [bacterium]
MKTALRLIIISIGILLTGCSITVPNSSMINEEYIAQPSDFEILGDVIGSAKVAYFLGIFPLSTDRGYLVAYNDALSKAKDQGADGLITIFSDVRASNFIFIREVETIVYAKAIRRK